MNKQEYLKQLDKLLHFIPKEEKDDIIFDYEQHFALGIEEGKSETEVANALGDPRIIAKQFKVEFAIKKAENKTSISNIFGAIFAGIGLGFVNMIVVPVLFALFLVCIALCLSAVLLTLAGVIAFLATILYPFFPSFIELGVSIPVGLFLSIGITCLGLLFSIGVFNFSRKFYKGIINYLKMNLNAIRKRGR